MHHPYLVQDDKKIKYDCCCTEMGCFGCGKDETADEVDAIGIGMNVYFKIMKTFTACFFIIMIINLPLYVVYFLNNSTRKINSVNDGLFKSSLGNLGSSKFQFIIILVFNSCIKIGKNDVLITGNYKVTVECGDYKFKQIDHFGISPTLSNENKNTQNCRKNTYDLEILLNKNCDYGTKMIQTAFTACFGKKGTCTFIYNMAALNTACSSLAPTLNYIYMTYRCEGNLLFNFIIVDQFQMSLGGVNITTINRLTMSWLIVGIDVSSMFILLVAICLIPSSIVKRTNYYNLKKLLISDYSVHIRDLNLKGSKIYSEVSDVLEHIHTVMEKEDKRYKKDELMIYEINFPIMTTNQVDLLSDKIEFEFEIEEIKDLIEKEGNTDSYVQKLHKFEMKLNDVKVKLTSSFKEDLEDTDDLFLTFTDHNQKRKFYELYNVSSSQRCCMKCLGKKDLDHL